MDSTPRSRGNALFKAGDFAGAAAAYTEGLSPPVADQVAKIKDTFVALGLAGDAAAALEGISSRQTRTAGSSSDSSCTTLIHSACENAELLQAAKKSAAEEQTLLLCNRAACHLETGDAAAAAADALAVTVLQPCNPKAYFRLARALPRNDPATASIVATAVALLPPDQRSEVLVGLYAEVRQAALAAHAHMHAQPHAALPASSGAAPSDALVVKTNNTGAGAGAAVWLQLPEDLAQVACAGSAQELDLALRYKAHVIVLRPGVQYHSPHAFTGCRHSFALVGLGPGGADLCAQTSHALWVRSAISVTLVNVRLRGNGQGAAACLSDPGAVLWLSRCRVEDYPEVAVLVVGGRAVMDCCSFTRTAKQAIEVGGGIDGARRQLLSHAGCISLHLGC